MSDSNVLGKWICDHCGKVIDNVEDGFVQWLNIKDDTGRYQSHSLLLVHATAPGRKSCLYDSSLHPGEVQDMSLSHFMGIDGLMVLLQFLSIQKFRNNDEVIELIKRLHVPGYELVWRSLKSARSADVYFPDNQNLMFPSEAAISDILNWVEEVRANG